MTTRRYVWQSGDLSLWVVAGRYFIADGYSDIYTYIADVYDLNAGIYDFSPGAIPVGTTLRLPVKT